MSRKRQTQRKKNMIDGMKATAGIGTSLTVLFTILKLTGCIGWPMLAVLMPVLVGVGLPLIGVVIVYVCWKAVFTILVGKKKR